MLSFYDFSGFSAPPTDRTGTEIWLSTFGGGIRQSSSDKEHQSAFHADHFDRSVDKQGHVVVLNVQFAQDRGIKGRRAGNRHPTSCGFGEPMAAIPLQRGNLRAIPIALQARDAVTQSCWIVPMPIRCVGAE